MENQRLGARLNEISELATQGVELEPVTDAQENADLETPWGEEKTYELVI
jgi:hypothetical protein